ncbi:hypothetical protein [Leucobacter chromiireducens]|uniref:Uncharacterized protein n=1 Tax=Leucobacter chromiireducens subsp. solipictus TaxID=398235 RepID=A0ABS1SB77_9MICO|nr:hypothetical protein [Leucobacter chromiireducens]MBL3677801.1 hypothetical protein [Leucobacter chromiireducens subsp. solipictus]
MPNTVTPEQFLAAASVDTSVFELRPEYRARLVVIDGLDPESERRRNGAVVNSISALHQIPFGGEDFRRYQDPARLIRSLGTEPFDITLNGELATAHPESGEVVWRDDAGVTCRRWNWRQGHRTAFLSADVQASHRLIRA